VKAETDWAEDMKVIDITKTNKAFLSMLFKLNLYF
jgi:hypothetical protein